MAILLIELPEDIAMRLSLLSERTGRSVSEHVLDALVRRLARDESSGEASGGD